ncbi:MAG: LysM peptidoglycan-binding domain-containing protein [Chloroflexota bacterium]|nr:LysM peptidoglycan-binding domain-containing protein [Chloroflexota bacterium]
MLTSRTRHHSFVSIALVIVLVLTMAFAALPVGAQEACAAGFESYTIRFGDTLSHVARLYGVTFTQLRADNNIPDANLIYYGTTLCINPANITTGLVPPPAIGEACPIEYGYTLSGVAYATGSLIRAIADNNRLANPDLIFAGETLLVPAPGTGC